MRPLLCPLAVGISFLLGACATEAPPLPLAAVPDEATAIDPDLVVSTAEERVRLADHRGRVLVLSVAPASSADAWLALDDAYPDLAEAGAHVIGIVTDGRREVGSATPYPLRHAEDGAWAHALGYAGEAIAVVIGPGGALRGHAEQPTGDDIVALAAPALLEVELSGFDAAPDVDTLSPATVESLVRGGAALIDVRSDGAPLADAVAIPLAALRADLLPLDPDTPIVFVGPDAQAARARAETWGFRVVYAVPDAFGLVEAPAPDELPDYDPRDDLPRVRG